MSPGGRGCIRAAWDYRELVVLSHLNRRLLSGAVVLCAALIAVGAWAGLRESAHTYSTQDVVSAFAHEGLTIRDAADPAVSNTPAAILVPDNGSFAVLTPSNGSFTVFVSSDAEAKRFFKRYEDDKNLAKLALREANVVVIADASNGKPLPAAARANIRAALANLG